MSDTGEFPTRGGVVLTIRGSNFGLPGDPFAPVPIVTIGDAVSCPLLEDDGWTSTEVAGDTLKCVLPEGQGKDLRVEVDVDGQKSSRRYIDGTGRRLSQTTNPEDDELSYDPPVVDAIAPLSGPTSGELLDGTVVNITINGSNFRTSGTVVVLAGGGEDVQPLYISEYREWTHERIVFQ